MKANEYAEALGQSVGKAFYISENQSNYPQPVMFRSMNSAEGSSGKQTIAIGELEVSVAVQVGFLLN